MQIAAKQLNISKGNISNACVGRLKTYKKFIWKFENKEIVESV